MKSEVYRIIKAENGATFDRLSKDFPTEIEGLRTILDDEIRKGFIVEEEGIYRVRIFLLPPVRKPARGIAWDFNTIQEAGPVIDTTLATEYMNIYNARVASRQQGDRGTCVGQGSASMKDYLYQSVTKQEPTGTIIRNILQPPAIYDQLYDQSFSAESAYVWSRQEGNITYPSGSYCNAAIRALYKKGICLESQWRTSKSSRGTWATPFPESISVCEWEAAQHKLEGYASINTLNDLKRCLSTRGVALGAINIYENYMSNGQVMEDGKLVYDGNLPNPQGSVTGSHALCWIGYSDATQRLFYRHSWEGWTKIGSISYLYWDQAGGDFWAPLDTQEALIGKKIYQTIEISVSPPEATLTINGVKRTEPLPAKLVFEKGTTISILVEAPGYQSQTRELLIDDGSVTSISFTLEAVIVPEPEVPLWDRILKWVQEIINQFFKR